MTRNASSEKILLYGSTPLSNYIKISIFSSYLGLPCPLLSFSFTFTFTIGFLILLENKLKKEISPIIVFDF